LGVTGNSCKKGLDYANAETSDPRRMVATTVKIHNGFHPLLPVYTERPVPKPMIPQVLAEIRKVEVEAPVVMKSVVLENVLGTEAEPRAAPLSHIHKHIIPWRAYCGWQAH